MKKRKVEDMVEELNKYCKNSLSFTKYTGGWLVSSYEGGSLFRHRDAEAPTFKEAVEKAYQKMLKDKEE